jgi:hypothetical protein
MNNIQEAEEFEGHLKLFLFSLRICVEVDFTWRTEKIVCNYMYLKPLKHAM